MLPNSIREWTLDFLLLFEYFPYNLYFTIKMFISFDFHLKNKKNTKSTLFINKLEILKALLHKSVLKIFIILFF